MKVKERIHQMEFEKALTKVRDEQLWAEIKAKYGVSPDGPLDLNKIDPEDAKTLMVIQARQNPDSMYLTPAGKRYEPQVKSTFKPPSNIRDESVNTERGLLENLSMNPYLRGLLERK